MALAKPTEKFIDILHSSKLGQELVQTAELGEIKRRESLLKVRQANNGLLTAELPKHDARVAAAKKAVKDAEKTLRDAYGALTAVLRAKDGFRVDVERDNDRIDSELLRSEAGAEIDKFVSWIIDEEERTRKMTSAIRERTEQMWGPPKVRSASNRESVLARLAALRSLRVDAEALRTVADQRGITARLKELAASLPLVASPSFTET